jgi:hypothetical protein
MYRGQTHRSARTCLRPGREGLREAHGGAKRAKHRAKRSPECADPAKQGHAQIIDNNPLCRSET